MNDKLRECPIRLVEIFGGKDEKWKGWYNVFDNDGTCIIGPLEPYKAKGLVEMVEAWNKPKHEKVLELDKTTTVYLYAKVESLNDIEALITLRTLMELVAINHGKPEDV